MTPQFPPFSFKHHTATAQGRRLKFVRCEHCSAEYVYVMERETTGAFSRMNVFGETMFGIDNEAAAHAKSAAEETLAAVLDNDFDPVPCPACGHYQRYMFPKLLGNTGLWARLILLAAIVIGCLAAMYAVYHSIRYLQNPTNEGVGPPITGWSVLLLLCVLGLVLSIINKVQIRRFNPNAGDPQARIAVGRRLAVTREEFEKAQRAKEEDMVDYDKP